MNTTIKLMPSNYILETMKIYKEFLKNSSAEDYLMNNVSTDYIRAYREGNKLDSKEEKEVIEKLISYFEKIENYKRCAQLKRILEKEELSKTYVF